MNKVNELMRRAVASQFVHICRWCKDKSPEKFGGILQFIPKYTLTLDRDKSTWLESSLFPLDSHKKGKKCIYTSHVDETDYKDVYLFFLTEKEVRKLINRTPDMTNYISEKLIDLISNRWIITYEIYTFKNIYNLLRHLVMFERKSEMGNKPPVGNTELDSTWLLWTSFASDFCRSNRPISGIKFDIGTLSHFMTKCP